MSAAKNIFTIPVGLPFARTLARLLLEETANRPEDLARYRILLPTRRACRTLQDTLLKENKGRPMLLPRLQPIGDVDGEELSLSDYPEAAAIPPAIGKLERQLLLARYIAGISTYASDPARTLALAEALGQLIDQITIEEADLSKLPELAPPEFAEHWQISLEFLKVLTTYWPGILAERGEIDAADRRNRLIRGLAASWKRTPPPWPVIAAGSTGSMPATAELLSTIAGLEHGRVILPALDHNLDEESWKVLTESHPQYGLKLLLDRMETDRGDVRVISKSDRQDTGRRFLATEMMRPPETAVAWQHLAVSTAARKNAADGLKDLSLVVCDNERQEADTIALLFREALATPSRTAALVTPDRDLARRVAASCRRWGIQVDDSAGRPLYLTPAGIFLRLVLRAGLTRLAPVALLALLKHELSTAGLQNAALRKTVDKLEVMILRRARVAPGFEGIRSSLKDDSQIDLLNRLEAALTPLLQLCNGGSLCKFSELLSVHLGAAEALTRSDTESGSAHTPSQLWAGEDGEAAASFFTLLKTHAESFPDLTPAAYEAVIEQLMAAESVHTAYGTHPRLRILGRLEARLSDADLLIIGGLDEGIWPPDPGYDPWMSRPMRTAFGLPGLERSFGLAAHDFEQAFCSPQVVMTRSRRRGGAPTAPSRWLQRLETVLKACGIEASRLQAPHYLNWAEALDRPDRVVSCERPRARPPVALRPRQISVTNVEKWLRDPYAVYARYILRLRKLDPLEKPVDAAERGNLLHDTLSRFFIDSGKTAADFLSIAESVRDQKYGGPAPWAAWWPRISRIADWFVAAQAQRRTYDQIASETQGKLEIQTANGPFTLTARADRIDRDRDNGGAVIDYKSAGSFKDTQLSAGLLPQLPLEAAILQAGGYEDAPPLAPQEIAYWKLTGARTPGEIIAANGPGLPALIEKSLENLCRLVEAYESEQAEYIALPRPNFAPRFNDYEHLERVREWSVAAEAAEEG